MNRRRKFLTGIFIFCLLFSLYTVSSQAAGTGSSEPDSGPYTYTVTFYAGNQGAFSGTSKISVQDADSAPVFAEIQMRADGSAITVKGLKAGYVVTFDDIQGSSEGAPVKLEKNSQYYVRGLRRGGYDNSEVAKPAFKVEQDQDYVVAYGIKGDMVSYVIHYQDTDGNTLAPSRTYYGNVGDRPVVAHLYIEGYQPQAYNLTRELSRNQAENVFTFVYSRVQNSKTAGGGTAETVEQGTGTGPDGTAQGTQTQGAGTGGGAQGTPEGEGPGENVELDDEAVPLSEDPQDIIDLDDEDTPLGFRLDGLDGTTNMLGAVVVGVSGLAALFILVFMVTKRRRKKAE